MPNGASCNKGSQVEGFAWTVEEENLRLDAGLYMKLELFGVSTARVAPGSGFAIRNTPLSSVPVFYSPADALRCGRASLSSRIGLPCRYLWLVALVKTQCSRLDLTAIASLGSAPCRETYHVVSDEYRNTKRPGMLLKLSLGRSDMATWLRLVDFASRPLGEEVHANTGLPSSDFLIDNHCASLQVSHRIARQGPFSHRSGLGNRLAALH